MLSELESVTVSGREFERLDKFMGTMVREKEGQTKKFSLFKQKHSIGTFLTIFRPF